MFDQLKNIMQNGERYIVVENGKPEYVLMGFADYVALVASGRKDNPGHGRGSKTEELAKANAELEEVRAYTESMNAELAGMPVMTPAADPATIRLEDLPL